MPYLKFCHLNFIVWNNKTDTIQMYVLCSIVSLKNLDGKVIHYCLEKLEQLQIHN